MRLKLIEQLIVVRCTAQLDHLGLRLGHLVQVLERDGLERIFIVVLVLGIKHV